MQYKDYYKTLGVERAASEKEIKQAYRKMAREFHPDVNPGDKEAEKRFQEINEAYEVLSDADNRKKYDTLGSYWKQAGSGPRGPGRPPGGFDFSYENLGDLFNFSSTPTSGPGGSGFSSFFDRFFSANRGRSAPPTGGPRPGPSRPPQPSNVDVEISLEDAFQGTTLSLDISQETACGMCSGAGVASQGVCPRCRGSGLEISSRRLEVKIPPGAAKVRAGDVLVSVKLRPHAEYEVKGRDLIRKQTISLYEAMLGGEVRFRTPQGREVTLKIPPESQNGKQFRLSGQGLPAAGQKAAGDLYLRTEVELPSQLSPRERELFQELARLRSPNSRT